ncbi:glycosyltransferase [Neptunitalea lumnitzerae]|uniref:Glycosyl transferase n=1 Tax=Neptunitalea lumnitzerae TaxID=2965509 RepID=A0ABQ5MHK9_9FLAO|nr:glycosyltransferase [Neptunitalea sp. Y10]GLB48515.1 glycosyl transferase [Neptunitalea sp. Y10]
MSEKKRILVAPLNWGLGHATRCIPIIHALQDEYYEPVIASDGIALELLRKEFPEVEAHQLPSYDIEYAKKGKNFKLKMIWDSPKMLAAITKERKAVEKLVAEKNIDGIISDNRLGIQAKGIPCVFITHQLNVLTGNTTWLSSKIHQNIIKKYDECWVPDFKDKPNLSGKLGHLKKDKKNIKYIGPLSRLEKKETAKVYDVMALISGPEPQRTMLEEVLLEELKAYPGNILLVKGKIEPEQTHTTENNMVIYNYMTKNQLEEAFNQSTTILSRSGYTTIMDLAKLEKKAFFIPTPGQYEQEYLAKRLKKKGMVPYCKQEDFSVKKLDSIDIYNGFSVLPQNGINLAELFAIFD